MGLLAVEIFNSSNLITLIALIIGGGGLATLAGVVTGYWLNKDKQGKDHELAEAAVKIEGHKWDITRRDDRITKLEKDNDQLVKDKVELSQSLGEARGKIAGLQSISAWLVENNRNATAKEVATKTVEATLAKAADVIETTVTDVVVKAVEKLKTNGPTNSTT